MTELLQPRRRVPLLVGMVLLLVFAVLYVHASRTPLSTGSERPLDKARAIAAGEARAREQLADPESARFRGSVVNTKWRIPVVCGEVNYRNATGGYDGFQRFVSAGPVSLREDEMSAAQFRRLWSVMCEPLE